jgi:hypothetical protein
MAYKGYMSPTYKAWFRAEKARLTKALKSIGCTNLVFDCQYYYFTAYFTDANDKMWYMNSGDVRGVQDDTYGYRLNQFMYRTVTSYKDTTGGGNQWQDAKDLENWRLS